MSVNADLPAGPINVSGHGHYIAKIDTDNPKSIKYTGLLKEDVRC
jgi:hypothetical protein